MVFNLQKIETSILTDHSGTHTHILQAKIKTKMYSSEFSRSIIPASSTKSQIIVQKQSHSNCPIQTSYLNRKYINAEKKTCRQSYAFVLLWPKNKQNFAPTHFD